GVDASVSQLGGELSLSVDRAARLLKVGPDGQRIEVAQLGAQESISLPAAAASGEAVYYEAEPVAGGNKVVMADGDPPAGLLPCPIIFIRQNTIENPNRTPFMAFRNLGMHMFEDQAVMRLDPDGTLTQVL